MLEYFAVDIVADLLISPLGPALVLFLGAIIELTLGRWLRRPDWLTGLALFFVVLAAGLMFGLRLQPIVPVYSQPWQPLLQDGANLLWVGDGWNWYITGLVLLLGGLGILLELNADRVEGERLAGSRIYNTLAVHLGILGATLLFVGSGNLLTAILTWVVIDILVLLRPVVRSQSTAGTQAGAGIQEDRTRGLSLIGAMLLMVGLLLAGPSGPGQPLQGGQLPVETVLLMLVAAAIRSGIYPFHLWLMPTDAGRVDLAERLLHQMVPVLGGLWLLGWTTDLGADYILMRPGIVALLVLSLLGAASTAWTADRQAHNLTFVLVASAGLAALSGVLAHKGGPSTLIWSTTAFALGGGLWLVGERVWEGWGWQLPVSVGALALAGMPFTPGFLAQPSLSRLLTEGGIYFLFFWVFVAAQGLQVAAMLRSWGRTERNGGSKMVSGDMARLLIASVAIGLPLAVAGFLPRVVATLANLLNAIPPLLGSPPAVVAEMPVWITLVLPFSVGMGLVWIRSRIWPRMGIWPAQIGRALRLEWLFDVSWWGINHASNVWGNGLRVVEGAGYIGWAMILGLIGYLLIG
jgi:hypothetical protein